MGVTIKLEVKFWNRYFEVVYIPAADVTLKTLEETLYKYLLSNYSNYAF
jgi:hypothetical protein